MLRRPTWRLAAAGLLGLSLLVLAGSRLGAQSQLASMKDLTDEHFKVYIRFGNLVSGQAQPNASDKEVMEKETKYLIHRFHAGRPDDLHKYHKDFEAFVTRAVNLPKDRNNSEFIREVGPVLAARFKEVLDLPFNANKHPIVNVAPLLADAARLKSPALGDYLADVVASKDRHDVIKLFAARGLREFFPAACVTEFDEPLEAKKLQRKQIDLKRVNALVGFIDRKVPDGMSQPEADGWRYLRREALGSLAQAQVPAVYVSKGKPIEGPVAPVLLRVLSKNMTPEPGLGERIEAAIGVCGVKFNEKYRPVSEYNPEPGLYLVGRFLVDFANEYNKDRPNIRVKRAPLMPWKIESRRLELALKDFANHAKGSAIEKQARELESLAQPVLKVMSAGRGDEAIQLPALRQFALTLRPKMAPDAKGVPLFKTITGHDVPLDPPAAVEPEEKQ
jgi:hypothetical protein